MATKEHPPRRGAAGVCDCQSYRAKARIGLKRTFAKSMSCFRFDRRFVVVAVIFTLEYGVFDLKSIMKHRFDLFQQGRSP
jgi:hypothetical protein